MVGPIKVGEDLRECVVQLRRDWIGLGDIELSMLFGREGAIWQGNWGWLSG